MNVDNTSLILIGYQNDYFAPDGILRNVIEESEKTINTLQNTISLLEKLKSTSIKIISTPILFTPNYSEILEPVGILKTIKEVGAFKQDTFGGKTIEAIANLGDRVTEIPGKRGLNAFVNTELDKTLKKNNTEHIVIAGAVTSICIDSTGRAAHELGYKVTILSDCTVGRSQYEQDFYCSTVFPLYAEVLNHQALLTKLNLSS